MVTKVQEYMAASYHPLKPGDVLTNRNVVEAVTNTVTLPASVPVCVVMCRIPGNDLTPYVVHTAGFLVEPDRGADGDGVPKHGRWVTFHGNYCGTVESAQEAFHDRARDLGVKEVPSW